MCAHTSKKIYKKVNLYFFFFSLYARFGNLGQSSPDAVRSPLFSSRLRTLKEHRMQQKGALQAMMIAAVLALASEGSAESQSAWEARVSHGPAGMGNPGTAGAPEIQELMASHSALHHAAVAHAQHRKEALSMANGRPIHLPVIPKSPPVCSAPVSFSIFDMLSVRAFLIRTLICCCNRFARFATLCLLMATANYSRACASANR
jgi:hypothetical protein